MLLAKIPTVTRLWIVFAPPLSKFWSSNVFLAVEAVYYFGFGGGMGLGTPVVS
jgi:hypothetical protein